jgi:hypothetical protein
MFTASLNSHDNANLKPSTDERIERRILPFIYYSPRLFVALKLDDCLRFAWYGHDADALARQHFGLKDLRCRAYFVSVPPTPRHNGNLI